MIDFNENNAEQHFLNFDQNSCVTYTLADVKRFVSEYRDLHNFLVVNMNIRSFSANFDEFSVFMDSVKMRPTVLVLTETWFAEDTCVNITGYTGYHVCRSDKRGGGVSVYVDKNISSCNVGVHSYIGNEVELNTVKLKLSPQTEVCIVGIYRPPEKQNIVEFSSILRNTVSQYSRNMPIYLAGDFNIDLLQRGETKKNFVHCYIVYHSFH